MEAVSAALPHFDCLIDAACHHVGSSLVEICKRGEHLFRCAALKINSIISTGSPQLWKKCNTKYSEDVFFLSLGLVMMQNEFHRSCLTQRGNKVFVGTQGLHAAFVLVVPDPQGFVISTAHYESSSRMKQNPTHPVVMSHLEKHDWLSLTVLNHKHQHRDICGNHRLDSPESWGRCQCWRPTS